MLQEESEVTKTSSSEMQSVSNKIYGHIQKLQVMY